MAAGKNKKRKEFANCDQFCDVSEITFTSTSTSTATARSKAQHQFTAASGAKKSKANTAGRWKAMWIFFTLIILGVGFIVAWLFKRYPSPKLSWFIKSTAAFAWLTSFSILALVPVDVWATLGGKNPHAISVMWRVSYWSTQGMTWIVIPIVQGYADAGNFTFFGRLRTSIRGNLVFYLALGVLGGIGLFIVMVAGDLSLLAVPGFCIALSNTFGLLVVVLLLGHGLIAVPKYVWKRSNPETRLQFCARRIGVLAAKLEDAIAEIDRVCLVVQATKKQISTRDALRPYIEIIEHEMVSAAPKDLYRSRQISDDFAEVDADDLDYATDVGKLASLRKRVQRAIDGLEVARAQYLQRISRALELSEVCSKRQSRDYIRNLKAPSSYWVSIYWQFKCNIKPPARRVLGLLLAVLSITVVWSEATIALDRKPDLSPFSVLIKNMRKEWPFYIVSFIPLVSLWGRWKTIVRQFQFSISWWIQGYMCFCTYHSLFSLGAFRFYHLVPGSTPAYSILLNGSLLCRFAAPMAYNYLHIIRMIGMYNGHSTIFRKQMGAMEVVPFFGSNFNKVLPVFLMLHCLLILCNIWQRVARAIAPSYLEFDAAPGNDESSARGRLLIRAEQEAAQAGKLLGTSLGVEGIDSAMESSLVYEETRQDPKKMKLKSSHLPYHKEKKMQASCASPSIPSSRLDNFFVNIARHQSSEISSTKCNTGPKIGEQKLRDQEQESKGP